MLKVIPVLFAIPIELVGGLGAVQLPPGLTETRRERSALGRAAFCQESYLMSSASESRPQPGRCGMESFRDRQTTNRSRYQHAWPPSRYLLTARQSPPKSTPERRAAAIRRPIHS